VETAKIPPGRSAVKRYWQHKGILCEKRGENNVRRTSNHSQQRLFRGEVLSLTQEIPAQVSGFPAERKTIKLNII
jgi:hypothetical protein